MQNAGRIYLSKWPEKSDTYRTMRSALNRAAAILGEENDDYESFAWHEMRYEDTRALPAALADKDLAPATINKILSAVRGVLEVSWRLGMMPDEVYRKIEIENVAGNTVRAGRALTPAEMDELHQALFKADAREAAIMAVLAGTGIRRVELVRLIKDDYQMIGGRLSVRGKGNKRRDIPVGERWQPFIATWVAGIANGSSLMFVFEGKNPRRQVSYLVEKFCIDHNLKSFTPHDLRRTFGTHVEKVAGIAVAQKLLGHENIRTTALYVRVDEAREAAAVKDL